MIVGIGVDIVDVERFAGVLRRTPGLVPRLFTESERDLPARSLAARFAAKEALAKALGAPPGLRWADVEIRTHADGRPTVEARGTVAAAANERGVAQWHVSLSHDGGMAAAMVVAES